MMSSQPLYRIVYADGKRGFPRQWQQVLHSVREALYVSREDNAPYIRPVAVEAVSPSPRATGGER